jgi:hypothetical protein
MPSGQITTFSEIGVKWQAAERESDKRAVWRALAKGGWFRACRDAVQRNDRTTLETWLDASDSTKREIIHWAGAEAAQIVHTHILCGLAVCRVRGAALRELGDTLSEAVSVHVPLGFCRDLIQALRGEPLRKAERELSLTVLLVDTARNEGTGATLTLEVILDGGGEFYAVPELAFLRDKDSRQAEDEARACVEGTGLWRKDWDVRWRLQRRDGKPLAALSGPSIGAAFALGLAKLCAGHLSNFSSEK